MERLTIKAPSGLIHLEDNTETTMNAAIKKLAEYEDLEEQGKLLKMPCAVGDTYFEIETVFWIDREMCKKCGFYSEGSDIFRSDDFCSFEDEYERLPDCAGIVEKTFQNEREIVSCMEDDSIGKTIFFNQEKAEAVLKNFQKSYNLPSMMWISSLSGLRKCKTYQGGT